MFYLISKKAQLVILCLGLVLAGCTSTSPEDKSEKALSSTLFELAKSAEANFDYTAAAGHFNQLYVREPDNIDAVLGTARNMRYAGVPRNSIKELSAAIQKHGQIPKLVLELSKSQLTASRINDARESIHNLTDKGEQKWQFMAVEALILDRLAQPKKAQTLYLEVLKNTEGNSSVSNNLALSYSLSGDLDKGIKILEDLLSSDHSTTQTRQNLVMLLVLKGDHQKAEAVALKDFTPQQVAQNLAAYKLLTRHSKASVRRVKTPSKHRVKMPGKNAGKKTQKKPPVLVTDNVKLNESAQTYVVKTDSTVRYGPARRYKWVTFLKRGERVQVLGNSRDGKWFLITLPNSKKGFIHYSLVKPLS